MTGPWTATFDGTHWPIATKAVWAMRSRTIPIGLALLAGCVACDSDANPPGGSNSNTSVSAVQGVYKLMSASGRQGSEGPGPRNILQALPGSALSQQMQRSFSDAVVVGTVTEVNEGEAYRVVDAMDSPVPWDSSEIDVLSVHVNLAVEQQLCTAQPIPSSINFRFFVTSKNQIDTVRDGLEKMGTVAVFVKSAADPEDPVFYPADVTGLLSQVDADGSIVWPVARRHYGEKWTDGGETLESLRQSCPV